MPIDSPLDAVTRSSRLQNLLQQSSGPQAEALKPTLRTLNVKPGETLEALVKALTPVDEKLAARLLKLTLDAEGTNSSQKSAAATGRAASSSLAQALQLVETGSTDLKAANLKLAEVELRGQTLLAITNGPLRQGASIAVQVRNGRLTLLPIPEGNSARPGSDFAPSTTGAVNRSSPASQNPAVYRSSDIYSSAAASSPATVGSSRSDGLSQPEILRGKPLSQLHGTALLETLRAYLPRQSALNAQPGEALVTAKNLWQLLAQPANSQLRQEIPAEIRASLRTIASHLHTPSELAQPQRLQQILANSGIQMENRLAKLAAQQLPPGVSVESQYTALQAVARALAVEVREVLPGMDLKAALEGLATQLAQALPTNTPAPSNETPLHQLLKQLLMRSPRDQSIARQVTREQLLSSLQKQVGLALDKTLLNQLQSLQRSIGGGEAGTSQHWQVEIPIRYGHEIHHLQLRMDEEWVQQESATDNSATRKARQWLVKLSFDLPEAGSFHAHLCVLEDTVSANLWAEENRTLKVARDRLANLRQRLEADGVVVSNIECFPGSPPHEDIQLNYALVDVRT